MNDMNVTKDWFALISSWGTTVMFRRENTTSRYYRHSMVQ